MVHLIIVIVTITIKKNDMRSVRGDQGQKKVCDTCLRSFGLEIGADDNAGNATEIGSVLSSSNIVNNAIPMVLQDC